MIIFLACIMHKILKISRMPKIKNHRKEDNMSNLSEIIFEKLTVEEEEKVRAGDMSIPVTNSCPDTRPPEKLCTSTSV